MTSDGVAWGFLHLRNDGLPLASSIVSEGKGCEALDAGVGGFIIKWLLNLLLLRWVVSVAFLLR